MHNHNYKHNQINNDQKDDNNVHNDNNNDHDDDNNDHNAEIRHTHMPINRHTMHNH